MAMDLGSIMAHMRLDISNFSTNLRLAEDRIRDTERSMSGFTDIGGRMTSVGKKLTMGLTMPIVGVGVACTKFFTDFEGGMAKIGTVADTTKIPIDQLGKQVIKLSDDSGLATSDLQAGLYDVLSAGVKTEDSMAYLGVAVKAAKGGFTDTATAVDGLTSTLNAYGLEASKANEIANQMMVAQNLGKTTFGELSSVIGNVAPTANALSVSTKELFSSLAVLTANGIKTSEATTGLKATFSGMIKPSKEATDAAKAMGLQFDANTVKSKGFMPFLLDIKAKVAQVAPEYAKMADAQAKVTIRMTELEKAGKKNSDEYKKLSATHKSNAIDLKALEGASKGPLSGLATMFGSVEALNSVLTLTSSQGIKLYNDSMGQMGDGTDRVKSAFDKMSDTSGSTFAKSMNQLKNSGIQFGAALAPALTKISELFSKIASKLSELSPKQVQILTGVLAFVAVIGPIIVGIGSLITAIGAIGTAFTAVSSAISLAGGAMAILTGPIGITIAIVVALVAVGVLLYKNWDKIKEVAGNVGRYISEVWDKVKESTSKFITSFINFFKGLATWYINIWKSIAEFYINIWKTIISATVSFLTPFINGIIEKFNILKGIVMKIFNGLKLYFTGLWEAVKLIFLGPILLICDLVTGNFDKLKSDATHIMEKFKESFKLIWDGIKSILSTIVGVIVGIAMNKWNELKTRMTDIWTGISNLIVSAWNGYKNLVINTCTAIVNGAKNIWNGLLNFFTTLPSKLYTHGSNMFTSMKSGVNNTISGVTSAIHTGIDNGLSFITSLPGKMVEYGKDMIQGLIDGIRSMIGKVGSAVSSVGDKIRSFLHFSVPDEGPLTDYETWMPDFMNGMAKGISANRYKVTDEMKKMTTDIKGSVNVSSVAGGNDSSQLLNSVKQLISNMQKSNQVQTVGGVTLNIGTFNEYNNKDLQDLGTELAFYLKQEQLGGRK